VKRIALLLVFVACGGKIYGASNESPDGGGGADGSDPLGGGGHLLSGMCHFTSSFKPNGGDWIFQTDADGTSTATRPTASTFTVLCAGKGNESFYYELKTEGVATAVGTYTPNGQLTQVSNGREAEVTDWGPCSVAVTSMTKKDGHDFATGSFDCEILKTLTGMFLMKGTFAVPLP
jgi:hypothetical protein